MFWCYWVFGSVELLPPQSWTPARGNATDLATSGECHTLRGEANECPFYLPAFGHFLAGLLPLWGLLKPLSVQRLFWGRGVADHTHHFPGAIELLLGQIGDGEAMCLCLWNLGIFLSPELAWESLPFGLSQGNLSIDPSNRVKIPTVTPQLDRKTPGQLSQIWRQLWVLRGPFTCSCSPSELKLFILFYPLAC